MAGVVWMETTLERLGLTPSQEEWRPPQGDPTEQLLYQGAEMPEERKSEESLCTKVEQKVRGSILTDNEVFWPFFSLESCDNDVSCMIMCLLNLGLVQSL